MPEEKKSLITGRTIAGCKIERKLGAGGMGSVFLATHPKLGHIAMKLMRTNPAPPAQIVKRFFREAETLKQLKHPNIVRIYGYGKEEPFYYIAMEYINGETVENIVKRHGPLKVKHALFVLREIAEAISFAHQHNIVHRDIKPDNVIITPDSKVKIIDFGLVKVEGSNVTMTGQIMGTPMYMAPEQAEGVESDERTDIYSAGAVGFYMLGGIGPYKGKHGLEILLQKIRDEKPFDLVKLNPKVPSSVAQLIYRMMARFPENRFQDMATIRDILDDILKPKEAAKQKAAAQQRPVEVSQGVEAKQSSKAKQAVAAKAPAEPQPAQKPVAASASAPQAHSSFQPRRAHPPQTTAQKQKKGCGTAVLLAIMFFVFALLILF